MIDRALINLSKNVEVIRSKAPSSILLSIDNAFGKRRDMVKMKSQEENDSDEGKGQQIFRTASHNLGPRHYNRAVSMIQRSPNRKPTFEEELFGNSTHVLDVPDERTELDWFLKERRNQNKNGTLISSPNLARCIAEM